MCEIIVVSALVNIEELNPSGQQDVLYNDTDFELSCTGSGSNIDGVTWYKDDQPLDHKHFQIWELERIEGQYTYGQTQAVRSVVQWKTGSRL